MHYNLASDSPVAAEYPAADLQQWKRRPPRLNVGITIRYLNTVHSVGVSWNIKSAAKRRILRLTAWTSAPGRDAEGRREILVEQHIVTFGVWVAEPFLGRSVSGVLRGIRSLARAREVASALSREGEAYPRAQD